MDSVVAIAPPATSEVPIDAFGAFPEYASLIVGLGGAQSPPDPSYVFRTVAVRPNLGPIAFSVRFRDLKAAQGTILLQVVTVSAHPAATPMILRTVVLPLADLVGAEEVHRIEVIARQNMLYAVCGHIYDETDASASGLAIVLEQSDIASPQGGATSERAVPKPLILSAAELQTTPRLLSLKHPSLVTPVSQGWTLQQCRQPVFSYWMNELYRPAEPTPDNWEAAYLLQALRCYGVLRSGASGVGFNLAGQSQPALLASYGCSVLAVASHSDADPGMALEQLSRPELCRADQFFENVHFTTVDFSRIPDSLSGFDFAWSSGVASRAGNVGDFLRFTEEVMRCLNPGGLAVHFMSRSRTTARLAEGVLAYGRPDIERIVLSLISHGHEVAQLKFGDGDKGSAPNYSGGLAFGLIARRR